MTKVVLIEQRNAQNKDEQTSYGNCITDRGDIANIFINTRKNQNTSEFIDTLYHEFTHAVVQLFRNGRRSLTPIQEEKLAHLVGNIVKDVFRGYR